MNAKTLFFLTLGITTFTILASSDELSFDIGVIK